MKHSFPKRTTTLGMLALASAGIVAFASGPSLAQSTPPPGTAPEAMHGDVPWGADAGLTNVPMLYASRVRPAASFSAHLTGSQVVPSSVSGQAGNALFTLNAERNKLYFSLRLTSFDNPITAVRIRRGAPGSEGEIVKLINVGSDPVLVRDTSVPTTTSASAKLMAESKLFSSLPPMVPNNMRYTWTVWDKSQPLTPMLVDDLIGGRLHIDVVTAGNEGGEIRGQITNASNSMLKELQLPH